MKPFISNLINWVFFIVIAGLSFILVSDTPVLSLLGYTLNKMQIQWIEFALFGAFSFKLRCSLLHYAKRVVNFIKS